MGSLFIGTIVMSLLGIGLKKVTKTSPKVANVSKVVANKIKEINANQQVNKNVEAVAREDIQRLYREQKKVVAKDPEIRTHLPYVIIQTTPLANVLSKNELQKLADNQVNEKELLEQLKQKFDNEVHARLTRAADKVGFINVRKQVRSGPQQVASFSDNRGHGVRIGIQHGSETQIGLDLIGYKNAECESKGAELLQALTDEGIQVADMKKINHGDPDGFQVGIVQKDALKKKSKKRHQNKQMKLRRIHRG